MKHMLPVLALLLTTSIASSAEKDLLLHFTFDGDASGQIRDASDNGLHGTGGGAVVNSPAGKAMQFDGTSKTPVRLKVPEDKCFKRGSWSFMAWLKPTRLAIDDRQNQRRMFSFGSYPSAILVIDLSSLGQVTSYFCYQNDAGKTISAGASSPIRLAENEWAHVALSCDRSARTVRISVNGYCGSAVGLPNEFDGNYVDTRELTIGSGWHNYWGVMDEVKVYRRALSKKEVAAEFRARKSVFGVRESPMIIAAERRDAAHEALLQVGEAWGRREFGTVRKLCRKVLNAESLDAQFRSYAHLRIAQSYAADWSPRQAQSEYARIAETSDYPAVHRMEAEERARELKRVLSWRMPRDPKASRTKVPPVEKFAAEVFVSPDGDDARDGTRERPVASLARARDRVREHKARGTTGAICVHIGKGEYRVTEALALSAQDSGRNGAPVVYRVARGERAVFYGGARLRDFRPVSDRAVRDRLPVAGRGKVVQCDLKALGIRDYGTLAVRGFGQPPAPPTVELFVDGKPMTLARWPNEGFVGIRKLVQPGSKPGGVPSVFEYEDDRHARWTKAEDAWLFGYFKFLWADATAQVGKIDTAAHTVTTAEGYHYDGGMSTQQGIQYYAFNLLEEIDAPGEWYLNRSNGVLYLYPPVDGDVELAEVGMFPGTMVTMEGVSHVRFEGLTFDLGRYRGMQLDDCNDCLVARCTVSRMADNGIVLSGGRRNTLLGCDVYTIGRRATEVMGGDRETLTPGGHVVENCRIYDFGRIDRTYTPAIQLEGVGNRVAHNMLYDCPSSVMRIEGNDHLVEYNDVHSAVQESDDQGAIDMWCNATYRGLVFKYNKFHNIGKTKKGHAVHGQAGIRFDDAISGMVVYGNIFYRSANGNFGGVQMNSGRDNIMDNNIFAECRQAISGGYYPNNGVWRTLREGKKMNGFITNELYLSRYPELGGMLKEPAYNFAWRNVIYRCGRTNSGSSSTQLFANGVFEEDPGFMNAADGDFRLRLHAKLFETVGFRPIPVEEIGLYEDEYRATWPVDAPPAKVPDWRVGGH